MNENLDRWELAKINSDYHWNPTKDDSDSVKIITNVYEDWHDEIKQIIPLQTPYISNSSDDMEKHIPHGMHMYSGYIIDSSNYNKFPLLGSIGEKLGFKEYITSIQTQTTGISIPLHIDSIKTDNTTMRVIVLLQDWYWGQILQFGNLYLHNWKAGDVLYFGMSSIPHSTANCSPYSRTIAKITGKVTDKFMDLLNV